MHVVGRELSFYTIAFAIIPFIVYLIHDRDCVTGAEAQVGRLDGFKVEEGERGGEARGTSQRLVGEGHFDLNIVGREQTLSAVPQFPVEPFIVYTPD